VKDLYIYESEELSESDREDNNDDAQRLELLRPFSAVRNLYMFGISTRHHCIVSALKELIGGGITEVLLAMRNIFLGQI